jgi:hypothetical protein
LRQRQYVEASIGLLAATGSGERQTGQTSGGTIAPVVEGAAMALTSYPEILGARALRPLALVERHLLPFAQVVETGVDTRGRFIVPLLLAIIPPAESWNHSDVAKAPRSKPFGSFDEWLET